MKENISNIEYASLLYDFYGSLLDDNKREIMDLYHEDNPVADRDCRRTRAQ